MTKKVFLREIMLLSSVFVNAAAVGCSRTWFAYSGLYLLEPGHKPSLTTTQGGYLISAAAIGSILVSIPGGILTEKYGRKPIIILSGCINILSWFSLATFRSFEVLYMARFLSGIVEAFTETIAFPVIGEMASPQCRGLLNNLYAFSKYAGCLYFAVANSAYESYAFVQISGGIVALLFIPTIFWLIETPEYLIRKKQYEKARKNIGILRPHLSKTESNAEFASILKYASDKRTSEEERNWKRLLKTRSVRRSLLFMASLSLFSMLSGLPLMANYITKILPEVGHLSRSWYPLINNVLRISTFCAILPFIDTLPRRFLFISCTILGTIAILFGAVSSYMSAYHATERWKWIFVIDNFVMINSLTLIQALIGILRSELFPPGVKGFGNGLCSMISYCTIICATEVYSLIDTYSHPYVQYVFFAAAIIPQAIIAYIYLPETKGKTLAEIQTALESAKTERTTDSGSEATASNKEPLLKISF